MTDKHEAALKENTPHLYRDYGGRGFPADGWYQLILRMSYEIEMMVAGLLPKERDGFRMLQVKEKFGMLRVYLEYGEHFPKEYRGYVERIVDEAEILSGFICEFCGKSGKLRRNWWLKTLCDKCQAREAKKEINRSPVTQAYK